jgi:8-hydroxy-5-deazaflavin:NADPH oxidoreductase
MNIAVLGTGSVGHTLGSKLVERGHTVMMGARSESNERAAAWALGAGPLASHGSFARAAAFGSVIINCTSGTASLAALEMAGADNLAGKILMDVANPLDYSSGRLRLTVVNTDSLGEQIQRAFPRTRVVKTLNTMNCQVMVNPGLLPGQHAVFVSGNDAQARAEVAGYLKDWFGWPAVIDLGDITTARGPEMLLPLWVSLMDVMDTTIFNVTIVR